MDFVDATLVKLADPASRGTLFDATALEQMLSAAYDATALNLTAPFTAVFDEVQIGPSASGLARVEGSWAVAGSTQRTEVHLQVGGLSIAPVIRVDAIWRGAIVARTSSADAPVIAVDTDWPSLQGIDAQIITELGALPADPATLEMERKTRIRARIAAAFDQPALVTSERVDQWLRDMGASSASDFVTGFASVAAATHTRLTFAAPSRALSSPRPMPVAVALLIRPAGFSLAQLLWESRLVRERLEPSGMERATNGARQRTAIVVGWIVPVTTFDDTGWPGAAAGMSVAQARDARRAAAGVWLAREGIGLVTA